VQETQESASLIAKPTCGLTASQFQKAYKKWRKGKFIKDRQAHRALQAEEQESILV
jgi:hypothetical protein